MKLELIADQLSGHRKVRCEKFDNLDSNLTLVAVEANNNNPWVGKYDRRKSIRNENACDDITRATFSLKD
jgi:hypothetical protein